MAGSDALRRVIESHIRFRMMRKDERAALERSLNDVGEDEALLAQGTARSVDGAGIKTESYSYYFITARGIYFGGSVKAGLFKKEIRNGFVPRTDIHDGEVSGANPNFQVDMGFISCNDHAGRRALWMSFDDIAGNDASPIQLAAEAGRALGLKFE
jgi:hypothetical protein